eukprot:1666619-Prymnesium_polylepis.1
MGTLFYRCQLTFWGYSTTGGAPKQTCSADCFTPWCTHYVGPVSHVPSVPHNVFTAARAWGTATPSPDNETCPRLFCVMYRAEE